MPPWLTVALIVLASLIVLFDIFIFLVATGKRRRMALRPLENALFAHRGLHNATRAENSLSAFRAAVEAGYGIELDVRLSKDGELVVFHDDTLERVTEGEGRVDSYTLAELRDLRLCGTEDTIPTFREVLELVDGRVPLLIEIKEDIFKYAVTEKCVELLKDYRGTYIVESFNPLALGRFSKLLPEVPLGILSFAYTKEKRYKKLMYALVELFALNFLSRPDFVAYRHDQWKNPPFRFVRALFRPALFCWTVKSAEEERAAREHGFTGIIFEGYDPREEKK